MESDAIGSPPFAALVDTGYLKLTVDTRGVGYTTERPSCVVGTGLRWIMGCGGAVNLEVQTYIPSGASKDSVVMTAATGAGG